MARDVHWLSPVMDMVLTLTTEEAEMVRKALLNHIGSLRDEARRYSYAPAGIALCQQRARAEELVDRLVSAPPKFQAAA